MLFLLGLSALTLMVPAYCQAHRSQLKSGTGAESIALILRFNDLIILYCPNDLHIISTKCITSCDVL